MSKINYGYDINDCPMCGSPVELDGGSATECYGWAWQTLYIRCTDIKDKNCNMELNLTADMNYISGTSHALVDAWNTVSKK